MPPTAHQCGAAGHSGVVISFKNFLFDMPLIIYIYHLAHVKGAKDALQCYGQEIFCRRRGKTVYTFDNPFGLKLLCVLNPIHGARHASCTSSEVLRSGWFSYQEAPWLISSMPTLNLKYFPGFPLVFILGFSS